MAKPGRNDLCHCGSGRKFKKCCEGRTPQKLRGQMLMIVVGGLVAAAVVAGIASFGGDSQPTGARVWDPVHGHYHTVGQSH